MTRDNGIQLSDHFTYKKLFRFVLSPICTMLFTSIYGIVDGFFVSNYVGNSYIDFAVDHDICIADVIRCGWTLGGGNSSGRTESDSDSLLHSKKSKELWIYEISVRVRNNHFLLEIFKNDVEKP